MNVYSKELFDEDQLTEIQIGRIHGLSDNDISKYANPEISALYYNDEMSELRACLEEHMSDREFNFCRRFVGTGSDSADKISEMRTIFDYGVPVEEAEMSVSNSMTLEMLMRIRKGLEQGKNFEQLVKPFRQMRDTIRKLAEA